MRRLVVGFSAATSLRLSFFCPFFNFFFSYTWPHAFHSRQVLFIHRCTFYGVLEKSPSNRQKMIDFEIFEWKVPSCFSLFDFGNKPVTPSTDFTSHAQFSLNIQCPPVFEICFIHVCMPIVFLYSKLCQSVLLLASLPLTQLTNFSANETRHPLKQFPNSNSLLVWRNALVCRASGAYRSLRYIVFVADRWYSWMAQLGNWQSNRERIKFRVLNLVAVECP